MCLEKWQSVSTLEKNGITISDVWCMGCERVCIKWIQSLNRLFVNVSSKTQTGLIQDTVCLYYLLHLHPLCVLCHCRFRLRGSFFHYDFPFFSLWPLPPTLTLYPSPLRLRLNGSALVFSSPFFFQINTSLKFYVTF